MALIDDIKRSFNRGDNMVRKLILINCGVFVLINLARLLIWAFTTSFSLLGFEEWLFLPADLSSFITKPYTLFTYMFMHEGFFHILFNMLWLWYLGSLFAEYLGHTKLLQVYIWGGISGGLLYILGSNVLPALNTTSILLGASASVLAIVTGIATLLPNYQIRIFLWDIKLKYIAVAAALLSLFSLPGSNPGGNLAHLGGVIFGFLYVRQSQRYTFLDKIGSKFKRWTSPLFRKKIDEKQYAAKIRYMKTDKSMEPRQEDIDAILDKINSSGYDSLTRAEREILFKASRQD